MWTAIGSLWILFVLYAHEFAPRALKTPCIVAVYLCLIAAALLDRYFSPSKFWAKTRKAASCGCDKAIEQVAKVPALFQRNCSTCGAELG